MKRKQHQRVRRVQESLNEKMNRRKEKRQQPGRQKVHIILQNQSCMNEEKKLKLKGLEWMIHIESKERQG